MITGETPQHITRADWGSVTLAEYAALDIITRPDAEAILNRVWDDIHEHNPFRGDEPNRLTDDGRVWLAGLHSTVTESADEREVIRAAREFVSSMGTLTTMAAKRAMR
jgi:hypothetical protein